MLEAELRHWRGAVAGLPDLESLGTPGAWEGLESYLGRSVRASLAATTSRIAHQAEQVAADLAAASTPDDLAAVRRGLLRLRARYLRAEIVVAFFGDAVRTRSDPRIAAVLRGLDALAVDSMERVLTPLGIDVPPVLTYLDKGLGASILRSGARLWDASHLTRGRHQDHAPQPVAADVSGARDRPPGRAPHRLDAGARRGARSRRRPVSTTAAAGVAQLGERGGAGDVYAFALLGYAPVPALATVVDGTTAAVLRMPLGDPHPFGWLRVQFNAALCRSWYGPGPWDDLAQVWARRHPLDGGSPLAAEVARASLPVLDRIADACTRTPMRAFGGRPLAELADPSPGLAGGAAQAGRPRRSVPLHLELSAPPRADADPRLDRPAGPAGGAGRRGAARSRRGCAASAATRSAKAA